MKKLLLFTALAGLLSACSPGPDQVAKSYAENIAKGDIWEAKKLVSESTGKLLDLMVKNEVIDILPDFEFRLIKDSVMQNKAWVIYSDQHGIEGTINLVKIKGQWKVHIE